MVMSRGAANIRNGKLGPGPTLKRGRTSNCAGSWNLPQPVSPTTGGDGKAWTGDRSAARTDLHVLPTLDKQAIRQNELQFIVEGINPKSLWMDKTSGTTGTSLEVYWRRSMLPKWWALAEVMVRNVAGVGQDMPRAMMGGRPIVKGNAKQPPYWRFNRRWRQLYLSSYHVSRKTAPSYVDAIRRYGSQWIIGYGSAIAALAENALEAGVRPLRLRAAIVSGDTLLPGMRASIETFFGCKCFDSYGQSEGVATATECQNGRMHVIPAVGILEILREDGSPCAPGEVGEIVATGLFQRRHALNPLPGGRLCGLGRG